MYPIGTLVVPSPIITMLKHCIFVVAIATVALGELTTIYKVDYPEKGLCGEEINVTKSKSNPHWLFPMYFGGFSEGTCSDVGFTKFKEKRVVDMHPVPFVHHNLTFYLYEPTQTTTTTIELVDPSRGNRVVKMEFCMPSKPGTWPLYIFGHGAGCDAKDYQYFCQVAATAMVYQDSPAGPIFPVDFDSATAALDSDFIAKELPSLSKSKLYEKASLLYGKLNGQVVVGGHSMGGGMTVLAVGKDSAPATGIALFAPGLYTKPDATPFLKNISVPALVVSGAMDCDKNSLDKEAQPLFDGLASAMKVLVVLKGANHCQWIQPFEKGLGVCSTFEKNECHGIDRSTQHRFGAELFEAFSTGLTTADAWAAFEQKLASGETQGTWTYFSSKTSDPSKKLHNDCPCSKSVVV